MSDVKIQINSAEALTRLLGQDTELQAQVRDNIANDFIANHIKPLLSDARFANFTHQVDNKIAAAQQAIAEDLLYKKQIWGTVGNTTLSEVIKAQIEAAVTATINAQLKAYVTDARKKLEDKVEALFAVRQVQLAEYISAKIQEMVKASLATSLKEMTSRLSALAAQCQADLQERVQGERNISLHL